MTLCPEAFLARELEICYAPVAYVTNYAEGVRALPYRRGDLFEGMLPPAEASAVEAAKNAIPGIAIAAAAAVSGEARDCPCAVSMERYRKKGVIGPDFRDWVGGARTEGEDRVKLTDDQIRRICSAILARWKAKGLIRPKEPDEALVTRMAAEIRKDLQREEDLDRDAARAARPPHGEGRRGAGQHPDPFPEDQGTPRPGAGHRPVDGGRTPCA